MERRVALIVGINYYECATELHGCVSDAESMKEVLAYHGDGSRNFECHLFTASDEHSAISGKTLRREIKKLFEADANTTTVLFYFAGHGSVDATGGYLIASDCELADEGISLNEMLVWANTSKAKNKLIVLDSCHSGVAGKAPYSDQVANIAEGLTVLTASAAEQYSSEMRSNGVFTNLLVDALQGGAANLLGDVTPGSAYAHIDQSLGALVQRPVFKANVKSFLSMRRVAPPISVLDLRKLTEFFHLPDDEYAVDPSYDAGQDSRPANAPAPDPAHTAIFDVFRNYHRLNLLVPVGVRFMYEAAMQSRTCALTPLGKHYWRLVAEGLI